MTKAYEEEDIEFIRTDLVPEMVYNRCFCEPGSREFVEFDSVTVEPFGSSDTLAVNKLYTAEAVVRFSGEPEIFPLIIKLLPTGTDITYAEELFQNEELFYSKIAIKLGLNHFPKCYVADLGRYGRPVIVSENLASKGYKLAGKELDEDHLKLCLEVIGKIHGKGLKLKTERFSEFREFYAKFQEGRFKVEARNDVSNVSLKTTPFRGVEYLKSQLHPDLEFIRKITELLGDDAYETTKNLVSEINEMSTICHGDFSQNNVMFKYENGRPVDVKVINWQTIRYCSIGIDLGIIVFRNLAYQDRIARMDEIMKIYFQSVRSEYPNVSVDQLRKEFISKLLYAYIILSSSTPSSFEKDLTDVAENQETVTKVETNAAFGGEITDKELSQILYDLKTLGLFDS